MTRKSSRHFSQRFSQGFTIVELLVTVAIIGVLSALAYPELSGIAGRDREGGVATYIARLINRAKATAKMRNRAYAVVLSGFNDGGPDGAVRVFEGNSSSCRPMNEDLAVNGRLMMEYFLGAQVPGAGAVVVPDGNAEAGNDPLVGLRDVVVGDESLVPEQLALCVQPPGSILDLDTLQPFVDRGMITVRVQRWYLGEPLTLAGPPRRLEVPFGGPARLGLVTN